MGYNTRTAPPNSRWYLNSQEWSSFKAPNTQEDISQFARIASSGFLSPDPDYVEDGEDDIYSLELSGASPSHRFGFEHICVAIVCILLGEHCSENDHLRDRRAVTSTSRVVNQIQP